MRILSNLIITGSLNSTNVFATAPVSFSLFSSSYYDSGSSQLWTDEDLDLRRGLDNWSDTNPGKNKLSGSAEDTSSYCDTARNLFNCIVSQSLSGSLGWTISPGSSSYTASYTSSVMYSGSYSSSLYSGSISGSRSTYQWEDGCWYGTVSKLTSGGDVANVWDSFGILDKFISIYESIPGPLGCDPKFLNSLTAYKIVNERMKKWQTLICHCIKPGEYVDVRFGLIFHCNFPDGNPNNNKTLSKTWNWRVRKTASGKCKLNYRFSDTPIMGGVISPSNDDSETSLFTPTTGDNASNKTVKVLQVPFSDETADSYYALSTNLNAVKNPGLVYFNESDSTLYVYDGASWQSLAGGGLSKYTTTIGDDSSTTFVVTHSKNTRNVQVTVRETSSPYEIVFPVIKATTVNTVTVDFGVTIPTTNEYTVIVI